MTGTKAILQTGITLDFVTAATIALDALARHIQAVNADLLTRSVAANTLANAAIQARIHAIQTQPRPYPPEDGILAVWRAWKAIH